MTNIDVVVNGISMGNLLLKAIGGHIDPEFGTSGHNYIYLEVTNSSTGKIWLNNNLGAAYNDTDHANFNISQQATTSNDQNAFGDLYQWGRYGEGHEKRNSLTHPPSANSPNPDPNDSWYGKFITTGGDWLTPSNNSLWSGLTGLNIPCPSGFRLPSTAELDQERLSWSQNNSTGAYNSALKLTKGGWRRHNDAAVLSTTGSGYYWSGSVHGAMSYYAMRLAIGNTAFTDGFARGAGHSVRCIKD